MRVAVPINWNSAALQQLQSNYDADAAAIQAALEALDSINAGDIEVTGLNTLNTQIEISHIATTGFYKLGFDGQETGDIAHDATMSELQSALSSALGAGSVLSVVETDQLIRHSLLKCEANMPERIRFYSLFWMAMKRLWITVVPLV